MEGGMVHPRMPDCRGALVAGSANGRPVCAVDVVRKDRLLVEGVAAGRL